MQGEVVVEVAEERVTGTSTRGKVSTHCKKTTEDVWNAREFSDCIKEANVLKQELIKTLSHRRNLCLHPALSTIAQCLDISDLVSMLSGSKENPSCFDEVAYALHGKSQFASIIEYVASLPQVNENPELCIHSAFSDQIFTKVKEGIATVIWGENFSKIGSKIIEGPLKGKTLNQLMGDPCVIRLSKVDSQEFNLDTIFDVSLSTVDGNLRVCLIEQAFYEALYCEKSLYSVIGKEGCIVLDFIYNLGGSECLAEIYFGVLKSQLQDNQDPDTVDMCALLGFCLPEVSQCPEAIDAIVKIYREGDLSNRVAKHRSNIFYDSQGRARNKYQVSKVIDNLRRNQKRKGGGVPYLV